MTVTRGPAVRKYDESSITWLQGLEGVRAKPAMYVGGTDADGLRHLAKEILDNGMDEVNACGGGKVGVHFDKDGHVWVWDTGRGIPVGPHPRDKKVSTLTVVLTQLHAGGKMQASDASGYAASAGTHGVGAAVTNALSEVFEAWTFRDRKWHHQRFEKGVVKSAVRPGVNPPPLPIKTAPLTQGTLVRFKPDLSCFDKDVKIDAEAVKSWLSTVAYLMPKVEITCSVEGVISVYHQPKGLDTYREELLKEVKAEAHGDGFLLQTAQVDLTLQWSTYSKLWMYSYVSGSYSSNGGTHVTGMKRAIYDVLNAYWKKSMGTCDNEDYLTGLLCGINVKIAAPQFAGQTKERLTTKQAEQIVYDALYEPLRKWFSQRKELAVEIIERAIRVSGAMGEASKNRELAAALNNTSKGKLKLPKDLVVSTATDPTKVELVLVEGGSAGGTAKKARDERFQEVLCLSGKPINAYKDKKDKLYSNAIALDILRSVGLDPRADDPVAKLRVGKIIILSDADDDGYHISVLICSLLHKMIPQVFDRGMVYTCDAPLYTCFYNNKRYNGASLSVVRAMLPKGAATTKITRLKGWGEAEPEVLEEAAFNPNTRKLRRITAVKGEQLTRFLSIVAEDTAARKELLGLTE